MEHFIKAIVAVVLVAMTQGSATSMDMLPNDNHDQEATNDLSKMLMDIWKERPFDTVLLIHQSKFPDDVLLKAIFQFKAPKVIVKNGYGFEFIRKYNSEIVAIIVVSHNMEDELMATAAQTLNYMRQTRILLVAQNVLKDDNVFLKDLLKLCHKYKMTNVLLTFINPQVEKSSQFYKLQPYPDFHWIVPSPDQKPTTYYQQHWWNMHNATLTTLLELHMFRAFPYEDDRGSWKLNGFVARLIMLFAELFKAHLKMYESPDGTTGRSSAIINQMVEDGQLDIPMVMSFANDGKWLSRSSTYEVANTKLMVPCADLLTIAEVFNILLNGYFFGYIIICTLLLSCVHSLIDLILDGLLQPISFIFSHRVWPGVLGQSVDARTTPWLGHKLIHLLVFFAGLNVSAQFGANIKTLLTKPPRHRQIETFDDLNSSPLKILMITSDAQTIESFLKPLAKSLTYTDSVAYYEKLRNSFNTSTGYDVSSSSWEIFKRKQEYFSLNTFCIPEDLTILRTMPWAIQLQPHSELKEPLDYLIHRVHELGLRDAWYSSVFSDLLRTHKISIRDPYIKRGYVVLNVDDLFLVWMVVLIGLALSSGIFLTELLYLKYWTKCSK